MDTMKYRTRQEFVKKESPAGSEYIIALDAGYSSMKVYTENAYFCFPSFVKEIHNDMVKIASPRDILYKDEATGEIFMIGYNAQDMMSADATSETDGDLYGRNRYNTKKFHILCNTALAMALMDKSDDRDVVIETGLPSAYLADAPKLIKSLATPAKFSLKMGKEPWREFNLEINKDNIDVIEQPKGSFYSVVFNSEGKFLRNASEYIYGDVLVLDIGFGTFDFYGCKNRETVCSESLSDFGMRAVLECARQKIFERWNEDIRVSSMQKNLETGVVVCIDEDEMSSEERPIGDIIEEARREVFAKAIAKAKEATEMFKGYRKLIVTGGTGEAWYDLILEYFAKMKALEIVPSNTNDPDVPFMYSNVKGYYLICLQNHKSKKLED